MKRGFCFATETRNLFIGWCPHQPKLSQDKKPKFGKKAFIA
jgi:hypothetical protein